MLFICVVNCPEGVEEGKMGEMGEGGEMGRFDVEEMLEFFVREYDGEERALY